PDRPSEPPNPPGACNEASVGDKPGTTGRRTAGVLGIRPALPGLGLGLGWRTCGNALQGLPGQLLGHRPRVTRLLEHAQLAVGAGPALQDRVDVLDGLPGAQ